MLDILFGTTEKIVYKDRYIKDASFARVIFEASY